MNITYPLQLVESKIVLTTIINCSETIKWHLSTNSVHEHTYLLVESKTASTTFIVVNQDNETAHTTSSVAIELPVYIL